MSHTLDIMGMEDIRIIAGTSGKGRITAFHNSRVTSQHACTRCGGLMVREFCIDLWSSANRLNSGARRCVQCGDVIDAVILQNRETGLVSNSLPSLGQPISGIEPQVTA